MDKFLKKIVIWLFNWAGKSIPKRMFLIMIGYLIAATGAAVVMAILNYISPILVCLVAIACFIAVAYNMAKDN